MVKILKKAISYVLHGPIRPVYAHISYISPSNTLAGKKIIITGGGRGLGYAMAKRFVAEGADVLITGRDENRLIKSANELKCRYLVFDVCKLNSCELFIDQAEKLMGEFDVLINNAGVSLHEESFFEVTPETFNKQLSTNLEAPFFLTQTFIKRLLKRKQGGSVLFISSETGDTVDFRPYGYTKAAINSMVKGLAYLFKQNGIRINAIAPGITASDMTGISEKGNLNSGNYATGRYYLPDEVAQIAAMIISDASGMISGQVITCNNAQTVNARWK